MGTAARRASSRVATAIAVTERRDEARGTRRGGVSREEGARTDAHDRSRTRSRRRARERTRARGPSARARTRTSTGRGRNETPCPARGDRDRRGATRNARAAEWTLTTFTPSIIPHRGRRVATLPNLPVLKTGSTYIPALAARARSTPLLLFVVRLERRSPPRASCRSRTKMPASLPRAQLRFRLVRCCPVPSRTTLFFSRPPLPVARTPSRSPGDDGGYSHPRRRSAPPKRRTLPRSAPPLRPPRSDPTRRRRPPHASPPGPYDHDAIPRRACLTSEADGGTPRPSPNVVPSESRQSPHTAASTGRHPHAEGTDTTTSP